MERNMTDDKLYDAIYQVCLKAAIALGADLKKNMSCLRWK